MTHFGFQWVFLAGWIVTWVVRIPFIRRSLQNKGTEVSTGIFDQTLVGILFLGTSAIPLLNVLAPWLDFADYLLPPSIGFLAVSLLVLGLVILRKAHVDLGSNYSPDLEIKEGHELVTGGIYKHIRHPMYTAGFVMAVAQMGLLQNWIAGVSGLVAVGVFYIFRIPIEEEMMLNKFGDDYSSYRSVTRSIVPFIKVP